MVCTYKSSNMITNIILYLRDISNTCTDHVIDHTDNFLAIVQVKSVPADLLMSDSTIFELVR